MTYPNSSVNRGNGVDAGLAHQLLACLLFADDITLLASSPANLQLLLNDLVAYATTWNWTVNVPKTYILHFLPADANLPGSRSSMSTSIPPSGPLTIYGNPVFIVSHFKYLGIEFSIETGRLAPFLNRNLQSAKASAHYLIMMYKIGIPLSSRTVKNLTQSLVYSVLEFGMQTWGPFCPPVNLVQWDSFRLHVLRQYLRIHPFWNGKPRGPNIYSCSSIVLRFDWGISPTKHPAVQNSPFITGTEFWGCLRAHHCEGTLPLGMPTSPTPPLPRSVMTGSVRHEKYLQPMAP
jgi:hypothetical protein